jgi:hypothetical protein
MAGTDRQAFTPLRSVRSEENVLEGRGDWRTVGSELSREDRGGRRAAPRTGCTKRLPCTQVSQRERGTARALRVPCGQGPAPHFGAAPDPAAPAAELRRRCVATGEAGDASQHPGPGVGGAPGRNSREQDCRDCESERSERMSGKASDASFLRIAASMLRWRSISPMTLGKWQKISSMNRIVSASRRLTNVASGRKSSMLMQAPTRDESGVATLHSSHATYHLPRPLRVVRSFDLVGRGLRSWS